MKSHLSLMGHPIHPMLVGVPVGLIVWTLIADIVYLATDKNPMWYDIAFWSGMAGWVTALIAALPGFYDLLTVAVKTDAAQMAIAHMVSNVSVVGLYVIASAIMYDHGATGGSSLTIVVVLHALGTGLLGLAGWLGGEMVFRHHLGIIPDNGAQVEEEVRHARPATPGHVSR